MFPGINFILLDSDCLPVTLFEVEDLWTEAYLARFPAYCESGIPEATPITSLCAIQHRSASSLYAIACLQHSNGTRGSLGH